MLRQILILLAIPVVVAAVVIPAFYLLRDKMIFFPQKITEANREAFSRHEITIERDGVVLHGWFVKGEISKEKPLLVYYGGNGEEVSGNLRDLKLFGTESFLFMNYRGYGDSRGRPSEKNFFEDALFILDRIGEKENIALENVVLMGRSLGSGVAVHVASQRKTRGIILASPFDSLVAVAKRHYPWLPVDRLLNHRFESINQASRTTTPALFVMGDRDKVVPMSHSLNLFERWAGPKTSVVIKNAAHNDISTRDEYWRAIGGFLEFSLDRELERNFSGNSKTAARKKD